MGEFKLGPIQEAWIKGLEDHPELQTTDVLGQMEHIDLEDESSGLIMRYCCLGYGRKTVCDVNNEVLQTTETTLYDSGEDTEETEKLESDGFDSDGALLYSFRKLGLRDPAGKLSTPYNYYTNGCNIRYRSLTEMNDGLMNWTEIAAYMREFPENVFVESV